MVSASRRHPWSTNFDSIGTVALGHRSVGFLGANGVVGDSGRRIIEQAGMTDASIVVVPYRDRAGGVMAEALMSHLASAGIEATVIPLTDGTHDLNDWYLLGQAEGFTELSRSATSVDLGV